MGESKQDPTDVKKFKRLFISLMSHELKTPLTSIYGYVQLLNKSQANLTDRQQRWLHNLFFETTRMSTLIEEMLLLYQVEDGQPKIIKKNSSLDDIIHDSARRFESLYPDYNLILRNTLNEKDMVCGDSPKLTQVLTNFLSNAARFSPQTKDVVFSVNKDVDGYKIAIVDKGDGISVEKLRNLKTVLKKGEDFIASGSGLSIYVGNIIINAHKGKLRILSQKGVGTTIEVTLPLIP